jgi:hypothetical protein
MALWLTLLLTKLFLYYLKFRTWKLNLLNEIFTCLAHQAPATMLRWLEKFHPQGTIRLYDCTDEPIVFRVFNVSPPYHKIYRRYRWEWKYSDWDWRVFQKFRRLSGTTRPLFISGMINDQQITLELDLVQERYRFSPQDEYNFIAFDRISLDELLSEKIKGI